MKIRIKDNTVRYRLSKPEVAELAQNGIVEKQTEFISATLVYSIKQVETNKFSADFAQNTITLYVPRAALQQWAATDQIGLEQNVRLPDGNMLSLLLEKDFKCIDAAVTEEQSDFFENPYLNC